MMKRVVIMKRVWKLKEVDEVEQQGGGDEDRTPESFEYPSWPTATRH